MSYSRWSDSRWYTFWTVYCYECETTDCNKRDHKTFEIDCCIHFTYRELSDNIDLCLDKIKEFKVDEKEFAFNYDNVTEADLLELKAYMLRFISDVESEKNLSD